MVDQALVEQAKQLSVDERLAIIGELWDSIDHQGRLVSPTTAKLIDERLTEADAAPLAGRTWAEIKADWRSDR